MHTSRARTGSLRSREIGLLAVVALGFGLGFGVVAWATAPLAEPGDAPASRARAVPAIPAGGTLAAGDAESAGPAGVGAARSETGADEASETTPTSAVAEPADDAAERKPPDPELPPLAAAIRARHLTLPVEGVDRDALYDSFDDPRADDRTHHAIDIMAPRGTPVFAVEDGTIAKLDDDQPGGGIVVYQYGPERRFAYYYAHLEAFADGLDEGARVGRGQVLGYVGTTGNARSDAPHLHFAIFAMDEDGRWWDGTPVNPFGLF